MVYVRDACAMRARCVRDACAMRARCVRDACAMRARCVEVAALGRVRLCCTSGVKVLAWLRLGPMRG